MMVGYWFVKSTQIVLGEWLKLILFSSKSLQLSNYPCMTSLILFICFWQRHAIIIPCMKAVAHLIIAACRLKRCWQNQYQSLLGMGKFPSLFWSYLCLSWQWVGMSWIFVDCSLFNEAGDSKMCTIFWIPL